MATIKSYTDIEQSKKLAEILPLKSADMIYPSDFDFPFVWIEKPKMDKNATPCWSLAALLKIIKYYNIEADDGIIIKRELCYKPYQITTQKHNDIINACIEMILKLKESDLL